MQPLIFLAHRLPFPPNKGDKVRSYHFLKHLASRYRLFIGTFIDDSSDWKHVEALRLLCADLRVEAIVPWQKRAASLVAFLRGEPLTLPYFHSPELRRWVERIAARERVTSAYVYSSSMAQYVLHLPEVRCLVDFVDVDSAKWSDYASRHQWPLSTVYRREARCLLAFERLVAARAEASIFVTDDEAQLFRTKAPDCAQRVVAIPNGVDGDYFSPSRNFDLPFAPGEHPIVFTGAMDYWPNVDAVVWFAREVLPEILRRDPRVRFYVVGMNPASAVRALASVSSVIVTGRVDDVRPYLQHARVVVAPLRVARGVQNKVLEAMAMAKPVVATPAAGVGLSVDEAVELEVASDAKAFAAKVVELMDPDLAGRIGSRARLRVLRDYSWSSSLKRLDELLKRSIATDQAAGSSSHEVAPLLQAK